MSTRRRRRRRDGTNLNCARGHLELGSEFFAEDGVGLGVLAEDVLEDLELVSGGPLAVFYFIGDVGEESPEIDRRGVDSGGHQGRNASTGIPWLGEDTRVHLVEDRVGGGCCGGEGGGGEEEGAGSVGRKGGRLGGHGRLSQGPTYTSRVSSTTTRT